MTANINEAIAKVKAVGSSNTRIVALQGGKCQIEVHENGSWHAVVSGVTQQMAEDIVAQASNRVILG